MNNASISIVMNGIHKCSGACLYCSAAKSMDYRGKDNENSFKFYPDKLKKRILEYTKNALEQGKKQDGTMLSVDIWGGNPVENFEPFKKVVEFCENELKEFRQISKRRPLVCQSRRRGRRPIRLNLFGILYIPSRPESFLD